MAWQDEETCFCNCFPGGKTGRNMKKMRLSSTLNEETCFRKQGALPNLSGPWVLGTKLVDNILLQNGRFRCYFHFAL